MATIGVGAKLEYESGSAWAEVADVRTITFPEYNVTSIQTTKLGQTDYQHTFVPGMIDLGVVTFECSYSDATYTALVGLVRETVGWRVSGPGGTSGGVTADGFLTKIGVSVSPDEEVMIAGEIKMTGVDE